MKAPILGLALLVPFLLAPLTPRATAMQSPPTGGFIWCASCSAQITIPAGTPQTLATLPCADADALFENDAALTNKIKRWIANQTTGLHCGGCPKDQTGCARTVESDAWAGIAEVDVVNYGNGTCSVTITFPSAFHIWICCDSCSY